MSYILFDYKCKSCNHIFEDMKERSESKTSLCPECGEEATKIFTLFRHKYKDYVEGWWEHIATEPIYIHNRRHLREECERHGCYANIDDGILGV